MPLWLIYLSVSLCPLSCLLLKPAWLIYSPSLSSFVLYLVTFSAKVVDLFVSESVCVTPSYSFNVSGIDTFVSEFNRAVKTSSLVTQF